jgi:hypothetical protein
MLWRITLNYHPVWECTSYPLSDFRALIERRPEALYWDERELAILLGCSESEIEEARRWMLEDGLEFRG